MNTIATLFQAKRSLAAVAFAALLMGGVMTGCVSQDAKEEASQEPVAQEVEITEEQPQDKKKGMDFSYSQADLDPSYDLEQAVLIDLTGEEVFAQDERVIVEGTDVTITDAGVYVVSGMLSDGQVVVDAPQEAEVKLVLSNAAIHNEDGPAIYCRQAGKLFVTLDEGSQNSLTDGSAYQVVGDASVPSATLFSACDLTLNGTGALDLTSAYQDSVASEGTLVVTGGTYSITAAENGLYGRNAVKICGGAFDVSAQADAVKSNNEEDKYCGFVSFDGGQFVLDAADNAIEAYRHVRLAGGQLEMNSVGHAVYCQRKILLDGAELTVNAAGNAVHSETVITMDSGAVVVESCMEGFQAEKIHVNDGSVDIAALDDALKAKSTQVVDEKASNSVTDEVEEGQVIQDDQTVQIETGMAEDGVGMGDKNCLVKISGGTLVLNAGGDAVDSNGTILMESGVVLASSSESEGNAPLDYDLTAKIDGGILIATGMMSMTQNFTGGSQPFALVEVEGAPGQNVAILNVEGKTLASFTPLKAFDCVLVSSPGFEEGQKYTLVVGGVVEDADARGYAAGAMVTGGNGVEFTASTTPEIGMGGLDANGLGTPAGKAGVVQIPKRK